MKHVLISGGAGIVGPVLAHRLLGAGRAVLSCDNLSRPGAKTNLWLLESRHLKALAESVP